MINKWLHIEDQYQPWVLPIWSYVNSAIEKGKIAPLPKDIYDLAIYISTKLNILPRIVDRLNNEVLNLFQLVKKNKK